jgi:hypothetical protein
VTVLRVCTLVYVCRTTWVVHLQRNKLARVVYPMRVQHLFGLGFRNRNATPSHKARTGAPQPGLLVHLRAPGMMPVPASACMTVSSGRCAALVWEYVLENWTHHARYHAVATA